MSRGFTSTGNLAQLPVSVGTLEQNPLPLADVTMFGAKPAFHGSHHITLLLLTKSIFQSKAKDEENGGAFSCHGSVLIG